ncbi:MAG: hypothetical protein KGH60_00615 [Candidatus Micrarchaeota archaeon]|nr:hypothetical protein [Candidatus Micrarchaeota archaeon]
MGTRGLKARASLRATLTPKTTSENAVNVYDTSLDIQRTMAAALEKTKNTLDAFSAYGVTQINNPYFNRAKATSDRLDAFVNPQKGKPTVAHTIIGAPANIASLKAEAKRLSDAQIASVKSMLTSTGGSLLTTGSDLADVMGSLKENIKESKDRVDKDAKKLKEYGEQLSEEDKKLSDTITHLAKGGIYGIANAIKNTGPDKRINNIVNQINKNVSNSISKIEDTMVDMEGNKLFLSQAIPLLKFLESNASSAKKLQAIVDFTNGKLQASKIVDMDDVKLLEQFVDNMKATGWADKELNTKLVGRQGTVGDMLTESIRNLANGQGTYLELLNLYKQLNSIWIRNSKFSTLEKAKFMTETAMLNDVMGMKALSRRELAFIISENPSAYTTAIGKTNIEFVTEYLDNKWYEEGYPGRYDFIWRRIEKKINKAYYEYMNSLIKEKEKEKGKPIILPP